MSSNVFASNVWYSGNVTVAGTTSLSGTRTVQAFPPSAMTGYLTTLSGSYGVGNYVASASSEYGAVSNPAWYAFDKSGTLWTSNLGYNSTTGAYNAANVTVATTGTAYFGEWLQLQQPVSTVLSTYSILDRGDVTYESPNTFYILGSRDGTSWTLVDSQSGITWSANQTKSFTVSTTQSFNYYRLVTNIINVSGGTPTRVSVGEWVLNGSIQGAAFTADGRVGLGVVNPTRALEVAGDVVCAGTLSAGNPLMFRNRIINGDMRISQRGTSNVGVFVTSCYFIDRMTNYFAASSGGYTAYQNTLSTNDTGPYQQGFRYSANVVITSTVTSNPVLCGQVLEGYTVQDFNWGTSFGSSVTISYWFKSSATGTFSYGIRNQVIYTYSYTGSFTYSTAGVWQYVSYTIPPPPTGSVWQTGNLGSWEVWVGGSFQSSAAAGWNAGPSFGLSGSANWYSTGGYIAYTGFQLEKGLVATPFEVRPYATELALCQRYYEIGPRSGTWYAYGTNNGRAIGRFIVPKRAAPTITPNSGNIYGVTPTASFSSGNNILMGTIGFTQYNGPSTDSFTADYTNSANNPGGPVPTANAPLDVFVLGGGLWTASAEL